MGSANRREARNEVADAAPRRRQRPRSDDALTTIGRYIGTSIYLKFFLFTVIYGPSWRRDIKCDCRIDWLWVRSPLEEMEYLFTFIISFLRSGVVAKRGVEFLNTQK